MSTLASTSAALVLLLALAIGLGSQGAFYSGARARLVGGVALALVLALIARGPSLASRFGQPVPMLLLLAGWMAVDGALHETVAAGLAAAALVAGVVAVLVVMRSLAPTDRALVGDILPLVGALIAGTAWYGAAAHVTGWVVLGQGVWRAAGALTYPNATAAVVVPVALLTLARLTPTTRQPGAAGEEPRSGPGWPAGSALVTLMFTAVAATLSRGGLLALGVGLVVLVTLGDGGARRAVVGPLLGAVVAFLGLLPSLPAEAGPNLPVATGALVLGLLAGWLVGRPGPARFRRAHLSGGLAAGGLLLALVALLAGVWLALVGPQRVGRAVTSIAAARLTVGSSDRSEAISAALTSYASTPIIGTGPGRAQVSWRDPAGASHTVRYLHQEYLQVLVEFGAVGGLLLLGVVVASVRSAWRTAPRGSVPIATRRSWLGAVAATLAFAAHSAVDFLWHVPALPLLAATVFAFALTGPDLRPAGRDQSATPYDEKGERQ
ncbi:MAG: O-antigen ligase family protein [Actinobacteria bacterium]|nr:O-antigen ligase family protein [Actinomycetota bacterium]